MNGFRNAALAAAAGLAIIAAMPGAGQAKVILSDTFNGPNLGSNSIGIGGGFSVGSGAASASGGLATVGGGGGADQNIYSNTTFNPTGTTLTWQAQTRPQYGAAGVMVGWAHPGIYTCAGCGPEIWLEARNDRTVFDVVDNNGLNRYYSGGPIGGTGPLSLSLTLTGSTWSFDITGNGTSINDSGNFVAGFAPSDVIASAGGNLSTFASVRSDYPSAPDLGTFNSVTVTTESPNVPEPAGLALLGTALLVFAGVRRRRG